MAAAGGQNRQWLLAAHPLGRALLASDFRFHRAEIPVPEDGEVLVRSLYFGFDPAQKGWLEGVVKYTSVVPIGGVIKGTGVGRVVDSRAPGFAPGDLVIGAWGWQDYATIRPSGDALGLEKLDPALPPTAGLSVLGITGLTAYFGLLDIGQPRPGDTLVVSGAAGATGSIVGQIGRIAGCRVVGIAGGAEKCRWLVEELGFDGAIDYKSDDVPARLEALCPDGVDIFFDNVGGGILDAVLGRLALNARVVLCGGIARYQAAEVPPGPRHYFNLIFTRSRMEGFIVLDHAARYPAARRRLWHWVETGRLRYLEDIQTGFENAPKTLMRLFEGANFGKQLLKLAET